MFARRPTADADQRRLETNGRGAKLACSYMFSPTFIQVLFAVSVILDCRTEPCRARVAFLIKELKGDTASLRHFYEVAKAISPFPVEEVTLKDGSKGYFSHDTVSIGIKKGMAVKQKCKTLIHELAHGLLHRLDDPRRQTLTRNDREIEAEGTAFVVLSYFGFDTSEYSFPYVASWNGTTSLDSIQRAGEIIQKTAEKIINQLKEEMNERTEAA